MVIPAYLPCLKLTPIDGPTTYQQTAEEKIQDTLIAVISRKQTHLK